MAFETYPNHYLLAWGGTLHGTEIWSNSLRLTPNAGTGLEGDEHEDFLSDFEGDLTNFMGQGVIHSNCRAEWAKINRIRPDGRYLSEEESHTRVFAAPIPGTSAGGFPPNVAVAVTLLTGVDRGLASKGRFFLAGIGSDVNALDMASGRLSVGRRDLIQTSVAAFLNDINDNPGLDAANAGLDVSVVSQGNAFRDGVARKVTGVTVGRVLDTQRRRRSNLAEEYAAPSAVA